MAIQFYCINCGAQLQVDDRYGGKKIQCPGCQTIQDVLCSGTRTQTASPVSSMELPPIQNTFASENPYQTPITITDSFSENDDSGLNFSKVHFTNLFHDSVMLFARFIKMFLLFGLIFMILHFLMFSSLNYFNSEYVYNKFAAMMVYLLSSLSSFIVYVLFAKNVYVIEKTGVFDPFKNMPTINDYCMIFIGYILYAILSVVMGVILFVLFGIGTGIFFSVTQRISQNSNITAIFIFIIIALVILWLCGCILGILFRRIFFIYFILDRKKGPWESLEFSARFARGNIMAYLGVTIVFALPVIFLFVIGTIVFNLMVAQENLFSPLHSNLVQIIISSFWSLPIFMSLIATMYLQMTGQSTIFREGLPIVIKNQNTDTIGSTPDNEKGIYEQNIQPSVKDSDNRNSDNRETDNRETDNRETDNRENDNRENDNRGNDNRDTEVNS